MSSKRAQPGKLRGTPPLKQLTDRQLIELERQMEAERTARQKQARQKTKEAVLRLISDAGMPPADLLTELLKELVPALDLQRPFVYIDPRNHANTWHGVGRRPKWLMDYLAQGHQLEEFLAPTSRRRAAPTGAKIRKSTTTRSRK